MFSRNVTTKSTRSYFNDIKLLKEKIDSADAIVIGAGAGLSTAAGFFYSGERFEKYFFDACINYGEAYCPDEIIQNSIIINEDIDKVIDSLME